MHSTRRAFAGLLVLAAAVCSASLASGQTTTRPPYGCFKVTAKSIDIRETSTKNAIVTGTAERGDILIKSRRFCTTGGNWCFVATEKGVRGFADKSKIAVAACPARLSTKAN